MNRQRTPACELIVDYVMAELSPDKLAAFENHLHDCSACWMELTDLRRVHTRLTEDETGLPGRQWFENRKHRILNAVVTGKAAKSDAEQPSTKRFQGGPVWSVLRLLGITAVAVWVAVVAVSLNHPASKTGPAATRTQVLLRADQHYPRAEGVALIVATQHRTNLTVDVHAVPQQSQWGCYDVWGVRHGVRRSLGEFTVDSQGNGAVSVTLPSGQRFDTISVTLEPNWGDTSPFGPQVLDGSLVNNT